MGIRVGPVRRRTLRLAWVAAIAAAALGVGSPSQATPAACTSQCTVQANTNAGYVAPVIEVANGTDVRWLPTTTSHPTGEFLGGDPCFTVPVGVGVTPVPVIFESSASGVTATVGAETKPCESATLVGIDSWSITYHCLLHSWMNGTVIVDR